jgi:hypothetical protein
MTLHPDDLASVTAANRDRLMGVAAAISTITNSERDMTNILTIPVDPSRLDAAHAAGILKQGAWGDGTDAVCMMSALVPGARSNEACVTAGWPEWLVALNIGMFDDAETPDAAWEFAHAVATACAGPVDYDAARDRFLIAVLTEGDYSVSASLSKVQCDEIWWGDCNRAVDTVAALLTCRLSGEDVTEPLKAAAAAARAACAEAWAAEAAARTAARAAVWATMAATLAEAARAARQATMAAGTAREAWAEVWAEARAAAAAAAWAEVAEVAEAADCAAARTAARTAEAADCAAARAAARAAEAATLAEAAARTAYRAHLVNALINSRVEV